ncbi:MAG: 2,3,4,5-tetrahydropyridine-2,6-dicarboxylate N-succinyltransferase [Leptospiraceae bacterium]|nr:2,3,4,5-tetrahydropyridine-2,6-dicarboxylate N-succinyltransferase [Leptospiraceae bacterium]
MELAELARTIAEAYEKKDENPAVLEDTKLREAVMTTIALLDSGKLRVATPPATADNSTTEWQVNVWVKQAILLYFPLMGMQTLQAGELEFWDKIPLKKNYAEKKVRVVPPAVARYGSYLEPGVILMPSYVNIGAYVGSGTMVDTWATVGSCAQIGKNVHLSGGVGIGGVLEPPQGLPVIVEDNAFLGSRCVVVEGVRIGRGAVLGSGVILTASTKIIDASQSQTQTYKGYVPPNAVVIPGSIPKKFPGGEYHVPCALIIGKRKESTDLKTSLNAALREFEVSV